MNEFCWLLLVLYFLPALSVKPIWEYVIIEYRKYRSLFNINSGVPDHDLDMIWISVPQIAFVPFINLLVFIVGLYALIHLELFKLNNKV